MSFMGRIKQAYQATNERISRRRQLSELDRLKDQLEKREKVVLTKYKEVVIGEPGRDGGHLGTYQKVKERCDCADQERKKAVNPKEEQRLIQIHLNAIRFAIAQIEEAADHIALGAVKNIADISKKAKQDFEEIMKGKKD